MTTVAEQVAYCKSSDDPEIRSIGACLRDAFRAVELGCELSKSLEPLQISREAWDKRAAFNCHVREKFTGGEQVL